MNRLKHIVSTNPLAKFLHEKKKPLRIFYCQFATSAVISMLNLGLLKKSLGKKQKPALS